VAGPIVATRGGEIVEHVEVAAAQAILWLKLAVELVGAIVIGVGCIAAVLALVRRWGEGPAAYTGVRLLLARYLALGLEFQLAADILVTAVAPSWEEIGKLAAVAAIRTLLNFFLAREIKEERAEEQQETAQRANVPCAAEDGAEPPARSAASI
jgi:uncharacterized membrane protein